MNVSINTQCIVIFPVYKPLTLLDRECFIQAEKMTDGYKKVFIAPKSFQLDKSFDGLFHLDIIRFDDFYFEDIQGYNKLMLSEHFYKEFELYKYMLIHQADAYLFKPELQDWCNRGYSYIGAPWICPRKSPVKAPIYRFLMRLFPKFLSQKKRDFRLCYYNVGNGGLSLRKISSFLSVLKKVSPDLMNKYLTNTDSMYNEDAFWSYQAPYIISSFKKPGWKTALQFSVEIYPEEAYDMLQQLPFGCHAFHTQNPKFWKQFIPFLSID